MMPRSTFATAALVLLLVPSSSTLAQDEILAAESAAKAGAETAEGKKFEEALGSAFGRTHGSTIQRCAKQVKRADLSDFDLFLRVDEGGTVDQALVRPATTIATCVRDKMPGWKALAPPHAGFWVKVGVTLKSK
jgi:protein-tyrosine-phosphatase